MFEFKDFITEEKNTHMTHVQDMVLHRGVNGTRQAINALRDIRDTLAGSSGGTNLTMKWDGAPAVFFGQVPKNEPNAGAFFVAKKGLFAKTPKFYTTDAEIDADISSGELNAKMKMSLRHLKDLKPKGIFQGDLMFSKGDIDIHNIDGKDHITFQPNTIVYSIEDGTKLAKRIKSSKVGIVVHTRYSGHSWDSLTASYDVKRSEFSLPNTVWVADANIKTVNASLTKKETQLLTQQLSMAGKLFRKIAGSTLRQLEGDPAFARELEAYNNTFIRRGQNIPVNSSKHVEGLINHIHGKYQKKIDILKTERGKTRKAEERDEVLKFFSKQNKRSLVALYDLQRHLVHSKMMVIKKLNELDNMKTLLRTKNGFKVTGHEGFVAINNGNAFKLVDQLEFSHANFSDEVLKGWQK